MTWLNVDTQALLKEVQEALEEVERTGNKELRASAESVLSALVVVLRRKNAQIPPALAPHVEALLNRRR